MDLTIIKSAQRPFSPITRLLIILFLIGLLSTGVLHLVMGPEGASTLWLLAHLAWRLVPPPVWAVAGATAVFWLWLMRRLWGGEPIFRPKKRISEQTTGFFI